MLANGCCLEIWLSAFSLYLPQTLHTHLLTAGGGSPGTSIIRLP
jgi:hypothetical protein